MVVKHPKNRTGDTGVSYKYIILQKFERPLSIIHYRNKKTQTYFQRKISLSSIWLRAERDIATLRVAPRGGATQARYQA